MSLPGDHIIHFDQVNVGDRITFTTRDNGYGGTGGGIGVFKVDSHGRGRNTVQGANARLARTNWYDRSPRRAEGES